MLLEDALALYLNVKLPTGKPDSERLHYQAIARFGETIGRTPKVSDLTDENLGKHARRRIQQGRSRDTVRCEQKRILAQWRFYARRGLTEIWPECTPVSGVRRTPEAWTEAEFNRLWVACDIAQPMHLTPGSIWWRSLLGCLFFTGERIGAMIQLQWTDIRLETGWLIVPAEVRKGSVADRSYQLPAFVIHLLRNVYQDRSGPFDVPCCLGTIYNRYKKILKAAGLPSGRRSKFHRIRRTTASHYAAAGGNAQELLGHSSPKVTKLYIDPAIVKQPQAADLLFMPRDTPSEQ